MINDDADNAHGGDLPADFKEVLRKIKLINWTISELASGASLFNIINLIDGERFNGPIEGDRFGKCGIVWLVSQPDHEPIFENLFCTAIGPKPELEYGETEDQDTDKLSDNARRDLLKKIKESCFEVRVKPRHTDALLDITQSHIEGATSSRVPICVVASYNVSSSDAITLVAYHPCIPANFALEVWMAHFSYE